MMSFGLALDSVRTRAPGSGADERRRIARELHDGLAQELAYLVTQAKLLARSHPKIEELRRLEASAQRALDETRSAISGLTNGAGSLAEAIEVAAEEVAHREGVRVELDLDREVDAPPTVRDAMVRIVREATTNAIRHGRAGTVTVRLAGGDRIRLEVIDDGAGFSPSVEPGPGRFGLQSMTERAHALDGELRVLSTPGQGTTVEVTVP